MRLIEGKKDPKLQELILEKEQLIEELLNTYNEIENKITTLFVGIMQIVFDVLTGFILQFRLKGVLLNSFRRFQGKQELSLVPFFGVVMDLSWMHCNAAWY